MAKQKPALCGCLLDVPPERLPVVLNHSSVDWIEWRLDHSIRRYSLESVMESLSVLAAAPRRPVIATNRAAREGGLFEGEEEERLEVLRAASRYGAEWLDLEADLPADVLDGFKSGASRLLLSHHHFSDTPDRSALRRMVESMARKGPHALKIATYARTQEDNLRVLELIPFARREFGLDMIAFCMGPAGLWSRFACLLLGSPWTYVQLPGQEPSAPGQASAEQMNQLLQAGGWLFEAEDLT